MRQGGTCIHKRHKFLSELTWQIFQAHPVLLEERAQHPWCLPRRVGALVSGLRIPATLALGLARCFHTEALAFKASRAPSCSRCWLQLFVSVS